MLSEHTNKALQEIDGTGVCTGGKPLFACACFIFPVKKVH